jgi:hypothetical protein
MNILVKLDNNIIKISVITEIDCEITIVYVNLENLEEQFNIPFCIGKNKRKYISFVINNIKKDSTLRTEINLKNTEISNGFILKQENDMLISHIYENQTDDIVNNPISYEMKEKKYNNLIINYLIHGVSL